MQNDIVAPPQENNAPTPEQPDDKGSQQPIVPEQPVAVEASAEAEKQVPAEQASAQPDAESQDNIAGEEQSNRTESASQPKISKPVSFVTIAVIAVLVCLLLVGTAVYIQIS